MSERSMSVDRVIRTFVKLKRLHQLNLELLEQLHVAMLWIAEHKIPLPNPDVLNSLFLKSKSLLNEIQSNEPEFIQYTISRRKVTTFRTDEEVPEPNFLFPFSLCKNQPSKPVDSAIKLYGT
jgi:hypothetical protein